MKIDKSKLNVAQIFLVYMTLIGDVQKTALALDLDPELVSQLAAEEGWAEKIRRCTMMSKSESPGDWERAQNRALNFVQAHRLRLLLDKVFQYFEARDAAEYLETEREISGRAVRPSIGVKFFTDLASALEKVHALSYHALGDTLGERKERDHGSDGEITTANLHTALIAALSSQSVAGKDSDLLVVEAAKTLDTLRELPAPVPVQQDGGNQAAQPEGQ